MQTSALRNLMRLRVPLKFAVIVVIMVTIWAIAQNMGRFSDILLPKRNIGRNSQLNLNCRG
jgi:hypothetical protein